MRGQALFAALRAPASEADRRTDELTRARLLFMTYNGWIMLAVAVGAAVGHLLFGVSPATKSVACH